MCRHLLFLNCTPFIDVQIQGSLVHQQVPAVRYCSPTPQASHFQLYPLTCTNFTFSPNCNYIACDSKSWECRFGKSGRFHFSGVFLDNTRSAQQRAASGLFVVVAKHEGQPKGEQGTSLIICSDVVRQSDATLRSEVVRCKGHFDTCRGRGFRT